MKKKLLIVTTGTGVGGIERCLIKLNQYLYSRECDIEIATWWKGVLFDEVTKHTKFIGTLGTGNFKEIFSNKNPIVIIDKLFRYIVFRILKLFGCPWKGLKKNKNKYDIAISYTQDGYSPYYIIDNVDADKKYLWYHELYYNKTGKDKERDLKYFKKYNNIICVSKACRNNLVNQFPSIEDKFVVLHNFYDEDEIIKKANEFCPYENESAKIILTVGRLSEEKGYDLAIKTCSLLKDVLNDFVWYWVGDGPDRNVAEQLIKEYNVSKEFVLLGNQMNPYPFIKHCDLYVQPSYREAYCTTTIEAKLLNKNIVVTDVPSFYEQFEDYNYYAISGKDEKVLSELIVSKLTAMNELSIKHIENISINEYSLYDNLFEI